MTAPVEPDDFDEMDNSCSVCGGLGYIEDDCTCGDDTCCCLFPDPPPCTHCRPLTDTERAEK